MDTVDGWKSRYGTSDRVIVSDREGTETKQKQSKSPFSDFRYNLDPQYSFFLRSFQYIITCGGHFRVPWRSFPVPADTLVTAIHSRHGCLVIVGLLPPFWDTLVKLHYTRNNDTRTAFYLSLPSIGHLFMQS